MKTCAFAAAAAVMFAGSAAAQFVDVGETFDAAFFVSGPNSGGGTSAADVAIANVAFGGGFQAGTIDATLAGFAAPSIFFNAFEQDNGDGTSTVVLQISTAGGLADGPAIFAPGLGFGGGTISGFGLGINDFLFGFGDSLEFNQEVMLSNASFLIADFAPLGSPSVLANVNVSASLPAGGTEEFPQLGGTGFLSVAATGSDIFDPAFLGGSIDFIEISFDVQAVPTPGSAALLGVAGLAAIRRRR